MPDQPATPPGHQPAGGPTGDPEIDALLDAFGAVLTEAGAGPVESRADRDSGWVYVPWAQAQDALTLVTASSLRVVSQERHILEVAAAHTRLALYARIPLIELAVMYAVAVNQADRQLAAKKGLTIDGRSVSSIRDVLPLNQSNARCLIRWRTLASIDDAANDSLVTGKFGSSAGGTVADRTLAALLLDGAGLHDHNAPLDGTHTAVFQLLEQALSAAPELLDVARALDDDTVQAAAPAPARSASLVTTRARPAGTPASRTQGTPGR